MDLINKYQKLYDKIYNLDDKNIVKSIISIIFFKIKHSKKYNNKMNI